jgi:hypothetical protein
VLSQAAFVTHRVLKSRVLYLVSHGEPVDDKVWRFEFGYFGWPSIEEGKFVVVHPPSIIFASTCISISKVHPLQQEPISIWVCVDHKLAQWKRP